MHLANFCGSKIDLLLNMTCQQNEFGDTVYWFLYVFKTLFILNPTLGEQRLLQNPSASSLSTPMLESGKFRLMSRRVLLKAFFFKHCMARMGFHYSNKKSRSESCVLEKPEKTLRKWMNGLPIHLL